MAETVAAAVTRPTWIDLASSDPAGSREFYAKVLGWQIEVSPDPLYGGYAMAKVGGKDVAGIGPKMMAEAPTAWSVYVGTPDVVALAVKVVAAGGTIIAPPMQVGDQGTMAVFQDPAGAYFGAWQAEAMNGFQTGVTGGYGWAELNARGLRKALEFYASALGWVATAGSMTEAGPPYTELWLAEERIAGAMEMDPMVPAAVPSYWTIYFNVDDVDGSFRKALESGAREMVAPRDFPGGRFAILGDPQGATFGILKRAAR
jgi:uncharacterized protein